ncbi:MAG: efflux RND transporter periplasmic adaptor subunit [Taibaiella sp.]|nr:efflux RND transporter periplasmic adaptor subunit [Taibaiella sp.]
MNKPFIKIILLLASGIFLFSCGSKKKDANATGPVPVTLDTVQLQTATYYDEYPGNTVALSQVELHADVEGYVTGIFFKEGDHVAKGQKLYEIDRSKYIATYNQFQANVRVAQANAEQAKKDADRYIYLNAHDAVAKQILDHAMVSLQNAKSQVTAAKQDLARVQTDLRHASITAPFSGTIGLSQVKLGTLVTVGQVALNTISSDDPMAVDFVINEQQLPKFLKLQKQTTRPEDSLFTLMMSDNSIYTYTGNISVIDRGVDPQTGTIKVRLVFPNKGDLRSGMSCKIRVHNTDNQQQLLIPAKAIVEQMGEYFVFVARDTVINEDTTKKDKKGTNGPTLAAIQKKVVVGATIDDKIIIRSGIEPGDAIVVEGLQKLKTGSPITTGKPGAPQGAAPKNSSTH